MVVSILLQHLSIYHIKVSQNLTLAPLVAYYSVAGDADSRVSLGKENKQSSVIGAMRIKWDF